MHSPSAHCSSERCACRQAAHLASFLRGTVVHSALASFYISLFGDAMIPSPLLAAPSVPSSPLQSWLASAPACAAAKSAGCLCSHSAADLRALRHAWHRSTLAALAAHTPMANSASDRRAFQQAAHADPFFFGMSVLNPQHVNVHSSSPFTTCLHSSTIAARRGGNTPPVPSRQPSNPICALRRAVPCHDWHD